MSAIRPWHPSRPEDPYVPELPGGTAVTVALVASPETVADGWAARTAAGMARGWALSGVHTYLCDLALEAPELHRILEMENDEGVTDLLLYGASPRRIAHRVEDGLFFAPAGTVAADPGAVRASPRWDALVDGFAEAGALLLLFVPAGAAGADALLARADAVVVLRREHETIPLGEAEERLLAAVGPEADADVGAGTARAARAPAGPPQTPEAEEPVPAATREAPARRGCGRWILIALVIIVLTLVLIGVMGWFGVPGLGAEVRSGSGMAAAAAPGAAAPKTGMGAQDRRVTAEAPLQAWGLTLEAHRDVTVAEGRIRQLQERWPDRLFWRAPVGVDGEEFHRVLAGPATTRDEAEAVRAALGGQGDWIVRNTHLAFLLGELPDLTAARTFTEALGALGLPTHILLIPATPGAGESYRVYSGSYASEAEAGTLRAHLTELGFGSAPLIERRGVAPE